MSKTEWPETLEEAVKSDVNVYIDASGSMMGAGGGFPAFDRALQFVRKHRGSRHTYAFSMTGVTKADALDGHGGGEGLGAALEHARRNRRRALVISDGEHALSGQVGSGQSWALAVLGARRGFHGAAERAQRHLHPARVYRFPTAVEGTPAAAQRALSTMSAASAVAHRMAQASRAAVEEVEEVGGKPTGVVTQKLSPDWERDETLSPSEQERANLELLAEAVLVIAENGIDLAGIADEALKLADGVIAAKRERETADRRIRAKDAWEELSRLTYSTEPDTLDQPDPSVAKRFRESANTLLDYLDHMEGSS